MPTCRRRPTVHDYTWVTVSGDKVEKWTEKLEQRDWAALEHAWSTAHSAPRRQGDQVRAYSGRI